MVTSREDIRNIAGGTWGDSWGHMYAGSQGLYWSSTLCEIDDEYNYIYAYRINQKSDDANIGTSTGDEGQSIRFSLYLTRILQNPHHYHSSTCSLALFTY